MIKASRPNDYGGWLLTAAAAVALMVSVVNYFSTGNGIAYSPGALLVTVSTALLLLAVLPLLRPRRRTWPRVLLHVWVFIDLIGSGFAAWLLRADVLLVLLVIALVGWLVGLFVSHPEPGLPRQRGGREALS